MNAMPVTFEAINTWSGDFNNCPQRQLAMLALSKTTLNEVAWVPASGFAMDPKFSVNIETLDVTNQEATGRCWLFSATNVLREKIAKTLNLDKFELSQSYMAFWDKFERANYFLEAMIENADKPTDDRTVAFLLATGVHDGGQWDMFANIVEKYGVVPKAVFGETYQSSHSRDMNHVLNRNLKVCAARLRGMVAAGADQAALQAEKNAILGKIYGFLCSCYTEPPKSFDFEYVNKDGEYHAERNLTPKAFCEKYVGDLVRKTVSVIHSPTADKPYHETYSIRYLNNVVGGRDVKHLNLPLDEFKAAVLRQLKAGQVVWFGSDVGKFGDRDKGIWDDQCFNLELLTGLDLSISKADALDYGFAAMNHAMVITGVNLAEDGKPTRWKIENSWGDKHGEKGYYICSDSWFDEYVYQAAIQKEFLGELAALAEKEPNWKDPWDPMGTLAD